MAPPLPVLTSLPSHLLVLASQYALCLALCAVLCSSPVRRLFGLVLEPTWLSSLLCTAPAARTRRPSLHPRLQSNPPSAPYDPTEDRSLPLEAPLSKLAPNSFATTVAETSDEEAHRLKSGNGAPRNGYYGRP